MTDCPFCRIVAGAIPARKLFEDDEVLAFADLHPQAPLHALIIPKRHLATLNDLAPTDAPLVGQLHLVAAHLAAAAGYADAGYRVLMNCNRDGGQSVFHIHLHLLAGRPLGWPPG